MSESYSNSGENSGATLYSDSDSSTWTFGTIFLLISTLLLMGLTVFGNGMVLLSWYIYKPVRSSSNLLLVSLAIPDFLIGAFAIPVTAVTFLYRSWPLGYTGCGIYTALSMLLLFVSSNHLVLIAMDRHKIVKYGLTYLQERTTGSTLLSIGFVWFVGLCIISPMVLHPSENIEYFEEANGTFVCRLKSFSAYIIYPNIFSLLLPSILMMYFYLKLYKRISDRLNCNSLATKINSTEKSLPENTKPVSEEKVQHEVSLESKDPSSNDSTEDSELKLYLMEASKEIKINCEQELHEKKLARQLKKSQKAARTVGTLIVCFAFFWYPFMLLVIFDVVFGLRSELLYSISAVLGFINSGVNPVIYAVQSKDFKIAFKRMGLPIKLNK